MNPSIKQSATSSQQPRVSIVLATNRNSPYMADTLESVRQQTLEDWELIIVDNGVPEQAHVEIQDLISGDPRMRMITIDKSSTAGVSRNIGVAKTRAELVTYLDDDDLWRRDRLEAHVAAHEEHPLAPASYSGYWHMDHTGLHFGTDWRSRQTTAREILSGDAPTPLGGTVMFRREDFWAIGGFSPEIAILVDFEFALRMALRGDPIYIDELLVGYRRHSTNMTSTAPDNVLKRRRVMEQMIDRQRWAALDRGETITASLLAERLHLFRRDEARVAGSALYRSLRRRRFADAARHSGWGLTRAPLVFGQSVAASPLAKAMRRLKDD